MSSRREFLETDLASWKIGPYHGALPGPMLMNFRIDGEIIVSGQYETGFLHRGLEKAFEAHTWQSAVMYADHLDPEASVFGELVLCLAVEEICEIPVTARARMIRILLCELTRISSHLGFIVRMAKAAGADTIFHYVLRDREKILDLFELLTGARFSLNFLRYGGVSADVTEGFVERVLETCDLIRIRLKEYNDIFTFNQAFMRRTAFTGVIPTDLARRLGMTGPNARASALVTDVRKQHPYSGYDQFDFQVPSGQGEGGSIGDAYDRFLLRLREIPQSIEILRQVAESLPQGDFLVEKVTKEFTVPEGEAYVRVESPRGLLGCHLVSDGKTRPSRVQFRVPSYAPLMAVPEIISGVRLEDLPVIMASLDISIPEVDR